MFINYDYAAGKSTGKFVPPDEEGVGFTVWNTVFGRKEELGCWHRVAKVKVRLREVFNYEVIFSSRRC
jgi:hypothetical protein